jgi:hypothetical protein
MASSYNILLNQLNHLQRMAIKNSQIFPPEQLSPPVIIHMESANKNLQNDDSNKLLIIKYHNYNIIINTHNDTINMFDILLKTVIFYKMIKSSITEKEEKGAIIEKIINDKKTMKMNDLTEINKIIYYIKDDQIKNHMQKIYNYLSILIDIYNLLLLAISNTYCKKRKCT